MGGPREHYTKGNRPVKERQMPYGFTHMWTLMNKLNYLGKWGQIHREQDDSYEGRLEDGGVEKEGKRTHGRGQHCCDCWGVGV